MSFLILSSCMEEAFWTWSHVLERRAIGADPKAAIIEVTVEKLPMYKHLCEQQSASFA